MEDIEDIDHVASEHDQLISAISKFDKTQHITEPSRNEPTNVHSEFNLIKRPKKLSVKNVAKVLSDTAAHVEVTKKLKKTQEKTKVLRKPLEKPQLERIKRATGYEQTKKKVGRWDPVVARTRTVDQVFFPLKQADNRLQPTQAFISKLKTKSELERELDEIDPPNVVREEDDEEQIYPMSYEEMVEHRQHLAKIRAQESYKAAKAKRQSKIKSKKYHRVLKKERLKLQLKEFEELQKTDPEEALKKLEALEKNRALERHTLRHKNTGKWAKNKMIRAKYDKEARQEIAEQLAVSRGLTLKTQDVDSSDDDGADDAAIPDVSLAHDPMNPWMLKQNNKSNIDAEFDFGYKKYLKGKMFKSKEDSDSENETDKNIDNTTKSETDLSSIKNIIKNVFNTDKEGSKDNINNNSIAEIHSDTENPVKPLNPKSKANVTKSDHKQQKTKKTKKIEKNKLVATSNWIIEPIQNKVEQNIDVTDVFDDLESKISKEVEKKLKDFRQKLEDFEKSAIPKNDNKKAKNRKDKTPNANLDYLKLAKQNKKPIIDEQLLETTSKAVPDETLNNSSDMSRVTLAKTAATAETSDSNIDPSKFIEVKPKFLNSQLPTEDTANDVLDDDDEQVVPKVNIEEVFEEDDVVASFRQEKEDEINKNKPEDIDLSLPGWGAWGGKGVKAPKRKRNRFITKLAPKMPRKDENKGDVIIKEYKDPKLDAHKLKELPYPFKSVKEFEASLRAPLGNTFLPESAHRKLTQPSLVTKAGTIIEPMDEDELLRKNNRTYKNNNVIKLINRNGR